MTTARLLTPKETYTVDYPEAVAYAEAQDSIFWTASEIEMSKDQNDLHNLTEAEQHAVKEILRLFTLYELRVGNSYWLDYVRNTYKRPEIQRMASVFGMMELNVHAVFYDKLNEVMGLKSDEFYSSYKHDKILKARMDWIDRQFSEDADPLVVLAVGSIVEGAVLYSNFAFLKHFNAQGKNCLNNMVSGINFSVRDENLHSEAGAWLYRQLLKEEQPDAERMAKVIRKIKNTCNQVFEHESRIIDMIFEKGSIKGITDVQMKNFIQSRLNLCLQQLDMHPMYGVEYDPISKWFYKNINAGTFQDFFHRQGNNYSRDWKESGFVWKT